MAYVCAFIAFPPFPHPSTEYTNHSKNGNSAFDPIVMLHHPNVDRLFAIWQTTYPNSYLSRTFASPGIATITPSDAISQDSPLTSFHSTLDGSFWTSSSVRDIKVFGHIYPETAVNNASCSIRAVNYLYKSSVGLPVNKTSTLKVPPLRKLKRDGPQ